jgi:uncharacterized repeat protein (TIGR03803 family)
LKEKWECPKNSDPSEKCGHGKETNFICNIGLAVQRSRAAANTQGASQFYWRSGRGTPYAGVIRDSAGSLYGTTYFDGSNLAGVVYKVDTSGHERVVYTFTGVGQNAGPIGGVVGDSAGNLYGTTSGPSGVPGMGMVYNTTGVQTVLYSFS